MNNLTTAGSHLCCGMAELGNFNYVDPPGGKRMTHYHRAESGSWNPQSNQDPTTREDIEARIRGMKDYNGAVIATTGAGQEYVGPILESLGFIRAAVFRNPGHANTDVILWCLVLNASLPHTTPGGDHASGA